MFFHIVFLFYFLFFKIIFIDFFNMELIENLVL
jgi:hypothetical protein